jgi:hypothetical protein
MSTTSVIRSFAVATFMIAKGYKVLGAETDPRGVVAFRFAACDADAGMRAYQVAKSHLDALAGAVLERRA